jgi:hypothetical protein
VEQFLSGLSEEWVSLKRESNSEYVLDVAGKHFALVQAERFKEQLDDLIQEKEPDKIASAINGYTQVKLGLGEGIDVLHDKEAWKAAYGPHTEPLIEFPGALGRFFGNALARHSFVAFEGPEGRGKSFWLQEIAFRAVLQRRRVAFFELGDMTRDQIMERMGCRFAVMPLQPCKVQYPKKMIPPEKKEEGKEPAARVVFETRRFEEGMTWQKAMKACEDICRKRIKSDEPYWMLYNYAPDVLHCRDIQTILTEQERNGWVADVVCIAEGSLVLTDKGLIPIESVTKNHKVWDGVNWVKHDGAVCKGEREVIEYAGLEATPEHEIWTETGWRTIESCRRMGLRIAQTGLEGKNIRIGENYIQGGQNTFIHEAKPQIQWIRDSIQKICPYTMSEMWIQKMDKFTESAKGFIQRLSSVLTAKEIPNMALWEDGEQTSTMSESEKLWMERLWWQRDRISISVYNRSMPLDCTDNWASQESKYADRPNRQRRTLRARQYPMVYTEAKLLSYSQKAHYTNGTQIPNAPSSGEVLRSYPMGSSGKWPIREPNSTTVEQIPATRRRQARVWDILNAGPLHRFTVQGVLVHNCIDYADNLSMTYAGKEGRDCINETWKHMRRISMEHHCLLVTATQTNAASNEAHVIRRKHFSDDKRKRATPTAVYGINQTETEKDSGIMRLNNLKKRRGAYKESFCVHVAGCLELANPAVLSTF